MMDNKIETIQSIESEISPTKKLYDDVRERLAPENFKSDDVRLLKALELKSRLVDIYEDVRSNVVGVQELRDFVGGEEMRTFLEDSAKEKLGLANLFQEILAENEQVESTTMAVSMQTPAIEELSVKKTEAVEQEPSVNDEKMVSEVLANDAAFGWHTVGEEAGVEKSADSPATIGIVGLKSDELVGELAEREKRLEVLGNERDYFADDLGLQQQIEKEAIAAENEVVKLQTEQEKLAAESSVGETASEPVRHDPAEIPIADSVAVMEAIEMDRKVEELRVQLDNARLEYVRLDSDVKEKSSFFRNIFSFVGNGKLELKQLSAELEQSRIDYEQALIAYREVVLGAIEGDDEVGTALQFLEKEEYLSLAGTKDQQRLKNLKCNERLRGGFDKSLIGFRGLPALKGIALGMALVSADLAVSTFAGIAGHSDISIDSEVMAVAAGHQEMTAEASLAKAMEKIAAVAAKKHPITHSNLSHPRNRH